MKALLFLLIWFTGSHAKLLQQDMAKVLYVSEDTANRLIERVEYIDRLNTHHAPYYTILSNVFLKERGYKIGCEIGVFTGGHAEFILANSDVEKLYCIDSYIAPMDSSTIITDKFEKIHWQACWDTIYYYTIDKLSVFSDRVQFLRLAANKAAAMIDDHSLDFVFIDGDHSYAGVLDDCNNYYDKVRSGGIISGDDYCIEDVEQALKVFLFKKIL